MPQVPSWCATKDAGKATGTAQAINDPGSGPCGKCFGDAHDDLAEVLLRFEKLRRVSGATQELYTWALAVGDGGSAIHGVTALGWQSSVRPQIVASMERFNEAYDEKFPELSEALMAALRKVAACEGQYFGNADWYDRYGFMFYNTVVERHRR